MRRFTPIVLSFTTAVAILVPALASGNPEIGAKHNGFSKADERALVTYKDCWAEFKAKCGRNIVDDGLASGQPPSDAKVAEWTATMDRWLNPPKPPEPAPASSASDGVAAPAPAPESVAPTTATTSSGGCPSYMSGEASSPSAVNPSSGASGCYQVLPSTAANYGSACADVNASSCVAAICASEGNYAWKASGATPCDYISQP